jgi:hypothetical protein
MLRFETSTRRLLLLDSEGARLYVREWRAPLRARELARFAPDEAGRQALSAWLEKARDEAVTLLVNLPGEAHLQENIPRLRGSERSAMIERRLRRHFPDNPFVMASSLGEVAGQRQEERLLLSALPSQPLQDWLFSLRQTRIAGVHGMAHVMAEYLRRAARLPPACLFLSLHARALRQTLLQNGRVIFSRLNPAPDNEEKNLWMAEETARLYAYLVHQQCVEPGISLPVCLLAETLEAELVAAFAHPDMRLLTLQALAWETPPAPGLLSGDTLALSCLTRGAPRQHYAPAALRQQYRLPGQRRLLLGVGLLFLLLGACSAGMDMLFARDLRAQNDATRLEVARLEKRAQAILQEKPELAVFSRVGIEEARQIFDAYTRYRAERPPEAMLLALQQLAALLNQHPGIHLEKLRWQAEERSLELQGRAFAADFARLLRELAHANIAHENRAMPENAPLPERRAARPFDLTLRLPPPKP